MDQLKKLFFTLSMTQKIGLACVSIFLVLGINWFTHWQKESNFKPLFTSMSPEDASAIVAKLKETGTEHRLADNGTTVLVAADKVDEARLELAGAGLPKAGRIGFEIFDKTNLNLTDFGERVNYRRAVEGELEKTIKAINGIDDARVHVTFPKDSVFLDSREAAKASVLVHVRPGFHLEAKNVVAIANLVGSAVEGLSPDAVSIVDMQGNLLSRQHKMATDGVDSADNSLDYQQQVEKDLTSKVEATLDPLLGDGKFRVGVTIDCDFSTSDQTDEVYDPTRSAVATTQKTEDLSQGGTTAGVPGTPSNLPRSQIRSQANGGSGVSGVSHRTESQAFQTSRTVREVKTPRGIIKKISAALLIDQDVEWQGKGNQRKRVLIPPSPEKLKAIHDVVAGVLGISTDRGDQLIVETLPFEQTKNAEEVALDSSKPVAPAKLTIKDLMADKKILIGGGAGLLFIVLLLGFLLRRPKVAPAAAQLAEKASIVAGHADTAGLPSAPGSKSKQVEGSDRSEGAEKSIKELEEVMPLLQLPEMTNHTKALLDHLRKSIVQDPSAAVNVVRAWMEEV